MDFSGARAGRTKRFSSFAQGHHGRSMHMTVTLHLGSRDSSSHQRSLDWSIFSAQLHNTLVIEVPRNKFRQSVPASTFLKTITDTVSSIGSRPCKYFQTDSRSGQST